MGLVERRSLVASILGLAALPLACRPALSAPGDAVPVFRTARTQYTLIRPEVALPPLDLTDLAGRPVRLSATPGQVMLVNVWATWCAACRWDLPLLDRFHRAQGDRVAVAAISVDTSGRDRVADYLQALSIQSLPIYLDPDGRLAGGAGGKASPLSIAGLPVTYLITPSGKVAGYIQGAADWLSDQAQALLAYYAAG